MNEIKIENPIVCKYCGSEGVQKYGTYKGVQRYFCKVCKRKFKNDDTTFHMKTDTNLVPSALNAYYRAIRAFCNWLHRQGYLSDNSITRVDPPKMKKIILPSLNSKGRYVCQRDYIQEGANICLVITARFLDEPLTRTVLSQLDFTPFTRDNGQTGGRAWPIETGRKTGQEAGRGNQ
jgi:hypothetical protein